MKYRIWDNVEKKYFEPIYKYSEGLVEEISVVPNGNLLMRKTTNGGVEIWADSAFNKDGRYSVERGSELEDCNGKEFYENDVYAVIGGQIPDFKGKIAFENGSFTGKPLDADYEGEPFGWESDDDEVVSDNWFMSKAEIVGTTHDY